MANTVGSFRILVVREPGELSDGCCHEGQKIEGNRWFAPLDRALAVAIWYWESHALALNQ